MNIFLFYFGRRGGGSIFTHEIVEKLLAENCQVSIAINSQNESLLLSMKKFADNQNFIVFVIKRPYLNLFSINKIIQEFKSKGGRISLNTMMSHRDYCFWILFKLHNIKRWQVIHDFTRHKGDRYPLNREILFRIRFSNRVFVLSKNVQLQLQMAGYASEILLEYVYVTESRPFKHCNYGLIIGRQRNYQGIERLHEITHARYSKAIQWIIAGEHQSRKYNLVDGPLGINRWLEDFQVKQLIDHARFVLLPYLEASQSGVLKLAQESGVFVVASPLPGLTEFIIPNKNGLISDSNSTADIIRTIENLLVSNVDHVSELNILKSNLNPTFKVSTD